MLPPDSFTPVSFHNAETFLLCSSPFPFLLSAIPCEPPYFLATSTLPTRLLLRSSSLNQPSFFVIFFRLPHSPPFFLFLFLPPFFVFSFSRCQALDTRSPGRPRFSEIPGLNNRTVVLRWRDSLGSFFCACATRVTVVAPVSRTHTCYSSSQVLSDGPPLRPLFLYHYSSIPQLNLFWCSLISFITNRLHLLVVRGSSSPPPLCISFYSFLYVQTSA